MSYFNQYSSQPKNSYPKPDNNLGKKKEILLNNNLFCLNTSKYVSVGIGLDNFQPKIKIGSQKGFNIILTEEEWRSLLKHQNDVVNYCYSSANNHAPIKIGDVTIYFETTRQQLLLIKLEKFNDNLYFTKETLDKLWEIQELIDYRIQMLKNQEFEKYVSMIRTKLNPSVDLLTNVYSALNPCQNSNSENVSTMLEMLSMYPNVIESKLRAPKRKYYEENSEY